MIARPSDRTLTVEGYGSSLQLQEFRYRQHSLPSDTFRRFSKFRSELLPNLASSSLPRVVMGIFQSVSEGKLFMFD